MGQTARDSIKHEVDSLFPDAGSQGMGDAMHAADGKGQAADGKGQAADGGFTPVMVRLTAAELETVDTLIAAGIASSRAEAIRWALARIRARPAYEQLRKRAHDIQRLQAEF